MDGIVRVMTTALLLACAAFLLAPGAGAARATDPTATPDENVIPPGEVPVIPTPGAEATFRITIYGEVPDGEYFDMLAGQDAVLAVCGDVGPPCEGGGRAYVSGVDAHAGSILGYTLYRRHHEGPPLLDRNPRLLETVVASQVRVPSGGATVELYYRYSEDGEPLGGGKAEDAEIPADLPQSGAGGPGIPLLGAALLSAFVALLAIGRFVIRRRKRYLRLARSGNYLG